MNQNQTRSYTNDKICGQVHSNSYYDYILYIQIARGKINVKQNPGRYLKDSSVTSRNENYVWDTKIYYMGSTEIINIAREKFVKLKTDEQKLSKMKHRKKKDWKK